MWILFKLPRQPFYDRNGNILSGAKRQRVFAKTIREEAFGGEWIVPELPIAIEKRYQVQDKLLIETTDTLSKIVGKSYSCPMVHTFDGKRFQVKSMASLASGNFNVREITEAEAMDFLRAHIPHAAEQYLAEKAGAVSGVTK